MSRGLAKNKLTKECSSIPIYIYICSSIPIYIYICSSIPIYVPESLYMFLNPFTCSSIPIYDLGTFQGLLESLGFNAYQGSNQLHSIYLGLKVVILY